MRQGVHVATISARREPGLEPRWLGGVIVVSIISINIIIIIMISSSSSSSNSVTIVTSSIAISINSITKYVVLL